MNSGMREFDPFQIMRHVLDAIDKVCEQDPETLLKTGGRRLSRRDYLWLTNPESTGLCSAVILADVFGGAAVSGPVEVPLIPAR